MVTEGMTMSMHEYWQKEGLKGGRGGSPVQKLIRYGARADRRRDKRGRTGEERLEGLELASNGVLSLETKNYLITIQTTTFD